MLTILLVYFMLFTLWIIGSAVVVYQNIKHYEPNTRMKLGLYIYVWVSVAIFLLSFYYLYTVDWSSPIKLTP